MALHEPPIDIPIINVETGYLTEPWKQWFIINKRDKANRVEDGTEGNLVALDADGNPADSLTTAPDGDFVGVSDVQELSNKTFAELVDNKILASDGSGGFSEEDLYDWVTGTAGRLTVTDDGDGTITLTVPLKASFGITSDANGLSLNQQANVVDASVVHAITDPADTPATADVLRDDLVTNAIPDIEAALNALGTKVNAILALLLASEMMAGP